MIFKNAKELLFNFKFDGNVKLKSIIVIGGDDDLGRESTKDQILAIVKDYICAIFHVEIAWQPLCSTF